MEEINFSWGFKKTFRVYLVNGTIEFTVTCMFISTLTSESLLLSNTHLEIEKNAYHTNIIHTLLKEMTEPVKA
jgi:hypothetical protein